MATKRKRKTEKEEEVQPDNSGEWWNEFSRNLKREILKWLPVNCVYKCRSVCKELNGLLSSDGFINHIWPEAAINKRPWLLLCDDNPNTPSMAFCLYTRTSKPCFSLSFMVHDVRVTTV